jgi:PAS domain S-box-containing protein
VILADGVCIDISERGEAESDLQRTNELLRAVIKAVPVAIDIINPDGKVLLWNSAAERLFGWNNSAIGGYPEPIVPESQATELQLAIVDTLAGRPLNELQMGFHLRDGSWTNVSMSTVLVHDSDGKTIGVLRIIEELGDRHPLKTSDDQANSSSLIAAGIPAGNTNILLNQYKTGERNFAGVNFVGGNFAGGNLCGAYFAEANLSQVDFSGASLNGSNFNYANLQFAILRGADLRGANLQYADLRSADLRGADLRGTDMIGANITDAIMDAI